MLKAGLTEYNLLSFLDCNLQAPKYIPQHPIVLGSTVLEVRGMQQAIRIKEKALSSSTCMTSFVGHAELTTTVGKEVGQAKGI